MAIKTIHDTNERTWFITFTCFNWLPLIEITNSYDLVYNWLKFIKEKFLIDTVSFVIMPNHVHLILHLPYHTDLNGIISNAKRFMAYEIIKRLKNNNEKGLLLKLSSSCTAKEKNKGQKHKVFEPSFDAKAIFTSQFLHQKVDYIHYNPVSGKWKLVRDFTEYFHSSASFYESNSTHAEVVLTHYLDLDGWK